LRDEGTSYHYLPPARSVEADSTLVQQISEAFAAQHIDHVRGTSWTTDAPYRETRRKVEAYRGEGVKAVEMEAAALFAVGQRLNVPTAAVLVIGDRLADHVWQPPIDPRPCSTVSPISPTPLSSG
jgi:uridine phosphorylase